MSAACRPIPQADRKTQQLAIQSIPAYAALAAFMCVLAPPVQHTDTNTICDLETWKVQQSSPMRLLVNLGYWQERGWCRLEQLAFFLKDYQQGVRPEIYVCVGDGQYGGGASVHGMRFHPRHSVFQGKFSCCALNHRPQLGEDVMAACDKVLIRPVVKQMVADAL